MLPAKHVICTLFDHRYLSRGLCMIGSARRHGFSQGIWVLCLSEECRQTLAALALPGVHTITLDQLEAHIPRLKDARADRGILEYYFTCMAALHTYLFDTLPDIDGTMYVDADIQFFASPELVFDAMIACGARNGVTPAKILRLISSFSVAASMIRSASIIGA